MSNQRLDANAARKRLYEVMDGDGAFEQKADRVLDIGMTYLDVDNGHVTRIDPSVDYWRTVASTDPPDGRFPPGTTIPLETTFCRRTIHSPTSVAIHHAPAEGFGDDPAYREHGIDCYHGTSLRRLLENLLRNAVEHGGDDVRVTVGPLAEGDGFYVADDGLGIPEEKREGVFESGYSTGSGGAGLGLSIVDGIADAHGWTIEVGESESGGARFEMSDVVVVDDATAGS